MKARTLLAFGLTLVCVTLLNGCVVALGNRVPPDNRQVTLGKQLTDLKQARDTGAISEEEYQTAKKRLVEGK